jgi:hypothetical protein
LKFWVNVTILSWFGAFLEGFIVVVGHYLHFVSLLKGAFKQIRRGFFVNLRKKGVK